MATPTFVQSASSIASASVAFTNPNTAGNSIVVLVGDMSPTETFGVTDSQGNIYSSLAAVNDSSGKSIFQVFYVLSIKAGPNTVTMSRVNATGFCVAIHEFSGVTTFDNSHSSTGTGNSQDSGGLVTSQAVELLFGFTAGIGSATLTSFVAGANRMEFSLTAGSGSVPFLTQYQLVSVQGTYHATSTTTVAKSGTFTWVDEIAGLFGAQPAKSNTDWQLGGRHHSSRIILPGRGLDA